MTRASNIDGLPAGAVARRVHRHRGAVAGDTDDAIAAEVPVAFSYNGEPFAVMMATPADLADFALGFTLSEGIVDAAGDLVIDRIEDTVDGIAVAMIAVLTAAGRDRLAQGSVPPA